MLPFAELAFLADRAGFSAAAIGPRPVPWRLATTLLLALLAPACGSSPGAGSWRADLDASRHVLIVAPPYTHDQPSVMGEGGTPLEGGEIAVAWCARQCAAVARPDERIVGCFFTPSVEEELRRRLRTTDALLDCAMRSPENASKASRR